MLARERVFVVCLANPSHKGVAGDPDKHEAVAKEGDPSKHSLLRDAGLRGGAWIRETRFSSMP